MARQDRCRTTLLLLVALILIDVPFGRAVRAAEAAPKIDPRYARIESQMREVFASVAPEHNALTIGIIEHGELAWTGSYGVADFKSKTVPDSRTLYHIAYITAYAFDRSQKAGIIVPTSHGTNRYKPLVREALKILNPTSPGGSGLQPRERH